MVDHHTRPAAPVERFVVLGATPPWSVRTTHADPGRAPPARICQPRRRRASCASCRKGRDASVVLAAGRSPTVDQWLWHFVDTAAAAKLRPRTIERHRLTRRQLEPHIGHHRLDRPAAGAPRGGVPGNARHDVASDGPLGAPGAVPGAAGGDAARQGGALRLPNWSMRRQCHA